MLGDKRVPKGTTIAIPMFILQHDPEHYPDPEIFDPERYIYGFILCLLSVPQIQ